MSKWFVTGTISASVSIEVEAENEDEAIEVAEQKFGGVTNYCGNGGTDKLIGVRGSKESIQCDSDVEFDEVSPI